MTEPDLRLRAVVPAPPKVVYEALTDPAALRVWLAEHADVDLPGTYEFWGRFTPDGAKPHQRVLHVDERTIRFAWTVEGAELGGPVGEAVPPIPRATRASAPLASSFMGQLSPGCLRPGHLPARLAAMTSSTDSSPEDEYADDEYADHDAEDREEPSAPADIPDDEPVDDVLEQRQEVPYDEDNR